MFAGIRTLGRRFGAILCSLQQSVSLPFSDVLTEQQIQSCWERHADLWDALAERDEDEDKIFTPAITLWGFLSQVLHKEEQRSCLAAVARIGVLLVSLGRPSCAHNSGPYCRARCKLPVAVIEELAIEMATCSQAQVPDKWLWKARHVKAADGTTVTMADTPENQAAYPQQSCQKEGLGFPIARLVVLFSLATAMVHAMEMGPYRGKETGELALLRQMMDQLMAGDVLLADKLFCSYFMIALLVLQKVDVVTLLHQCRKTDLRQGKRLAEKDHLITWERPQRPAWMDKETYAQMPRELTLRLVQVNVDIPGFRTKSLEIVTTLVDHKQYSPEELAELYRRRWLAELDLRSIKVAMGMDRLRSKSPEMVRKEMWACLLAYNVIRQKMLHAGIESDTPPHELSFTNALQVLAAEWMVLPLSDPDTQQRLLIGALEAIASQTVGQRPGRVEPRAVKRRPKPFPLLTMPRRKAQELLLQGVDPYKKQK